MPDPYKQQAHDKLWTLLEAHTPVTAILKAGNRVRQDGVGWMKRFFARAPNDFPRIEITNGRFTHSGWTESLTYATEQASAAGLAVIADSVIRRRCEFIIKITARDEQTDVLDVVEEAVQDAILRGGPSLDLSFVVPPIGPIEAVQAPAEIGGISRQQSTLTIPVLMEFTSGVLIA